MRSVGENPLAADTAGISPIRMRYYAVIASGAFAALGGVFLSIGFVHSFSQNMTAGKGFIGLAAVIFGKWKPGGALAAALLFGFSSALAQRLPVFSPSDRGAVPGAAVRAHADRRRRAGRALAPAGRRRHPVRAPLGSAGMAAPRLRVPNPPPAGSPLARTAQQVSDEVELYHRTYTTLLRSSGETLLRVLEPSHRSMSSSLHALAGSEELDLGAFLYAIRRLPDEVADGARDRDGPGGRGVRAPRHRPAGRVDAARGARAAAALVRRRQRHDGGAARLGLRPRRPDPDARRLPDRVEQAARCGCAAPTGRATGEAPDPAECAAVLGGTEDDWLQLAEAWGDDYVAAAGDDGGASG